MPGKVVCCSLWPELPPHRGSIPGAQGPWDRSSADLGQILLWTATERRLWELSQDPCFPPAGAQRGSVPAPPGAPGQPFWPGAAGRREGAAAAVLRHRPRADPEGPAEQPLPCIHLLCQPGLHGPRGQGALPELLPGALRPLLLRHRLLHVGDHVDPPEPRRRGPAGVPGAAGLAVHLPAGGAPALEVLPGGRAPAAPPGPRRLRALPRAADLRGHGRERHAHPDAAVRHGARLLLREHRLGQEPAALQVHGPSPGLRLIHRQGADLGVPKSLVGPGLDFPWESRPRNVCE
ncbi:hypothetical protein RLOC_00003282 [Lonchura striata]|uniref:Uncharacterized protein n=1 Tax=Lonchura striata TaxID=40157 RepID=A0A218UCR6_9PASE|nr:hypothetical protein RLOC_00003282 [Lonchura striata domestica]